jgi:hypothetical protein
VRATSHIVHLALAVASILIAGCEKQPKTCPGMVVAQFLLQGTITAGTKCDLASKDIPAQTISVPATLALDPASSAATLCLEHPDAAPLSGLNEGGTVTVHGSAYRNGFSGCAKACTAQVDESVVLNLTQDANGKVTAIGGTLKDSLSVPLGCPKTPEGSQQCSFPCDVEYSISKVQLE